MKLNKDKCHLIVSGYKHEQIWAQVGGDKIWESADVNLLVVTIDRELKFDELVCKICSKASRKLTFLAWMSKFLTFEKRKAIFKAFVELRFEYCLLIWMFHNRYMNNKINRLHERALWIVHNDYESNFEQLLIKDNSFCVYHQNIHRLMIELYIIFNNMTSFRSQKDLGIPSLNKVLKRKNYVRYFGSVIWNSLPHEIRNSEILSVFKLNKSVRNPDSCTCRLCKKHRGGVGFIWFCLSLHIDFINDFLHFGFFYLIVYDFCTKVFVNPGLTGLWCVQTQLKPWLDHFNIKCSRF